MILETIPEVILEITLEPALPEAAVPIMEALAAEIPAMAVPVQIGTVPTVTIPTQVL